MAVIRNSGRAKRVGERAFMTPDPNPPVGIIPLAGSYHIQNPPIGVCTVQLVLLQDGTVTWEASSQGETYRPYKRKTD